MMPIVFAGTTENKTSACEGSGLAAVGGGVASGASPDVAIVAMVSATVGVANAAEESWR